MPPQFADDVAIGPEVVLFRRILPEWVDWNDTDETGRPRIRSAAFQDYPPEKARVMGYPGACMSVGLEPVLRQHGAPPDRMLADHPDYGLAALRVEQVRATGQQGVMPWPEAAEPWHGVVFAKDAPKRTKSMHRQCARDAAWVHCPSRPG